MPSNPSVELVSQLTAQHRAQALLLGSAPTAVAHPPGRARSQARAVSRARAPPVAPPAQRNLLPNGAAAHQFLADSRAARIRGERAARPAPSAREQQEAREQRARLRARDAREAELQRGLDDFMSTASVATADPLNLRHL